MRSKPRIVHYYILTLLSPVIGVYYAIRNLSWEWRKKVLILAIMLFGGTIILSNADGYVLMQHMYTHYQHIDFSQWLFELKETLLFSPEPGTKGDVYSHVLSYVVGNVLGIPGQYFIFVSFVYGFFYVKSLSRILRWDSSKSKSFLFWSIIIIFVTYRFIDSMQSVRTYTGAWLLFYGTLRYYQTKKLKYFFLMLMAPLFHVAFFIIALPAYLVVFIRWVNPKIFVIIYVISFFANVNTNFVIQQLQTTDLGEGKVEGYYNENPEEYYVAVNDTNINFYKRYGKGWALRYGPHFWAIALIVMGLYSNARMNRLEIGLFTTGLLMAAMANVGDFIPVFSNRTMTNSGIFILATTALLLIRGELLRARGMTLFYRQSLLWICVVIMFPYLLFVAANMLSYTSIFMMVVAPFGLINDLNMSLRELIGFLIL